MCNAVESLTYAATGGTVGAILVRWSAGYGANGPNVGHLRPWKKNSTWKPAH